MVCINIVVVVHCAQRAEFVGFVLLCYLEGGQAVESGGVHGLWGHVGDVGDELLQVPAGLLQVGGVDNDLDKLKDVNM